MDYQLADLKLTPQQDQTLSKQLLTQNKESQVLTRSLFCSHQELEQTLIIIDDRTINYLSNTIPQKQKVLFWFRFCHKLNKWRPNLIKEAKLLWRILFKIQSELCPTKYAQGDLLVYLVHQLKPIQKVVEMLECKLIQEFLVFEKDDVFKVKLRQLQEYLMHAFRQLSLSQKTMEEGQTNRKARQNNKILKFKLVKVITWIFKKEQLCQKMLKEIYEDQQLKNKPDLFYQAIQMKCQTSVNYSSTIINAITQQLDWRQTLNKQFHPSIFTNKLFDIIFKTTSKPTNIFEVLQNNIVQESILLKFNLLDMSANSFSNFFPHNQIDQAQQKNKSIAIKIKPLAEAISQILISMESSPTIQVMDNHPDKSVIKTLSYQEELQLIRILTRARTNMIKYLLKTIPTEQPHRYIGMFLTCKAHNPANLPKSLLLVVKRLEHYSQQNMKTLDDLTCFILMLEQFSKPKIEKVYKDEQFMKLFINRINLFISNQPKIENSLHVLKFLIEKVEQINSSIQPEMQHPLSQLSVHELLISFKKNDEYSSGGAPCQPLYYYGMGLYKETMLENMTPCSLFYVNRLNNISQFFQNKLHQLANLLDVNTDKKIGNIEKRRLNLMLCLLDRNIQIQEEILQKIRHFLKKRPISFHKGDRLFDSQNEGYKLKINLEVEITQVVSQLEQTIKQKDLFNLNILENSKVLTLSTGQIQKFIHLLNYLTQLMLITAAGKDASANRYYSGLVGLLFSIIQLSQHLQHEKLLIYSKLSNQQLQEKIKQIEEQKIKISLTISDDLNILRESIALAVQTGFTIIKQFSSLVYQQYLLDISCYLNNNPGKISLTFINCLDRIVQQKKHFGYLTFNLWKKTLDLLIKQLSHNHINNLYRKQIFGSPHQIMENQQKMVAFISTVNSNGWSPVVIYQECTNACRYAKLFTIIREMLVLEDKAKQIYINDLIYSGSQALTRVQKSILTSLLTQLQNEDNTEVILFYDKVIPEMLKKIELFEKDNTIKEQKSNDLKLINTKIDVLSVETCQQTFLKYLSSFMLKLFHLKDSHSYVQQIQKLFEQIFAQIVKQETLYSQSLSIIRKVISKLQEIYRAPEFANDKYRSQMSVLNIYLEEGVNVNMSQFITPKFVNDFLRNINIMLDKNFSEDINISVKLFEKLLPESYNFDDKPQMKPYAISIINLLIKILNSTDKFREINLQSLVCKLLKSKHPYFVESIHHIVNYLPIESYSNIFCKELSNNCLNENIELDIKGYFVKEMQHLHQNIDGRITSNLSDFVFRFTGRYRGSDLHTFYEIAKELLLKVKQLNADPLCKVVFDSRNSLQQSKNLNNQFIAYKPTHTFIKIFQKQVIKLLENKKSDIPFIDELKKTIYLYPILLPFMMYYPVSNNQNGKSTFLEIVFRNAMTGENIVMNKILQFLCLDHSSIVRGKEKIFLMADLACYTIINKILEAELTMSALVLILYLCKLDRFCTYCNINFNGTGSLCQKIEQKLLKCELKEKEKQVYTHLICSIILSMLYRHQTFKKLSHISEYNTTQRKRGFSLFESCLYPFKVIIRKRAQQIQNQYQGSVHGDKEIAYELEEAENKLKSIYETYLDPQQQCEHPVIQPFNVSEQIFNNLSSSQEKIEQIENLFQQNSRISRNFDRHWDRIKICSTGKSKLSEKFDIFEARYINETQQNDEEQQSNYLEKHIKLEVTDRSNYAMSDYSSGVINSQEYDQQNYSQRMVVMYGQLLNILKDASQISTSARKLSVGQDVVIDEEEISKKLTQESLEIIKRINFNLQKLDKPNLSILQLSGKDGEQIEQFLKLKQIQTDFDLKEQTMAQDQFNMYCLSNATKLNRLISTKRNKVNRIEQEMLQYYVRRKSSSDSVDYIIDTIDQNYQLLYQKQDSAPKMILREKYSLRERYLNIDEIDEAVFPEISDAVLEKFLELQYIMIPNFSYNILIPLLENKRVQNKLVNTLILIFRHPFKTDIFPKFQCDLSGLQQLTTQPAIKDIKNRVMHTLLNYYRYSFYWDDKYLCQTADHQTINNMELQTLEQLKGNENANYYQQLLEILLDLYKNKIFTEGNTQAKYNKIRMLRSVQFFPDILIDPILETVDQLQQQFQQMTQDLEQQFKFIELRDKFNVAGNFNNLSKNHKFVEKMRQKYSLDSEQLNLGFIALFIELDIFDRQKLKEIHQNKLKEELKTGSILLFINEVLHLYTQQQLQQSPWVAENIKTYQIAINKIAENTADIKLEQCYRLLSLKGFQKSLSFETKTQLLKAQVSSLVGLYDIEDVETTIYSKRNKNIFEAAFEDLRYKPDILWLSDFSVRFINQNNKLQSGYGSGVEKDWYVFITKNMVNLDYGLFAKSSKNYYYFNRESWINPRHLQFYEFIGKMFALSIIKPSYFVSPSFSIIVYKMILEEQIEVKDLIQQFDQGQMLINLQKLRQFTDDSMFWQTFIFEDVRMITQKPIKKASDIQQSQKSEEKSPFYLHKQAVTLQGQGLVDPDSPSKLIKVTKIGETIELIPGGAEQPVTLNNLDEYIKLTKQKVYDIVIKGVKKQSEAFVNGVKKIIDISYLKKFTAFELRQLCEGSTRISVEELKQNVGLGYMVKENDQMIVWFWEIFAQLSETDKSHFIQHWTGSPKLPVEGLKDMDMIIVKRSSNDDKRIFSQTCFNQIRIPVFEKKEQLKEAMMMAVNSIKLGLSILEDD